MIPDELRDEIEATTGRVQHTAPVGGGCIANATRIDAAQGSFFLKFSGGAPGETFEAEAAGLEALRDAAEGTGLCVPRVLRVRNRDGRPGLLLLEWIEPGRASAEHGARLGAALAALHRKRGGDAYGFRCDNFIGSLPQENGWLDEWPAFFRERRLAPQLERARRSGHWGAGWDRMAERLLGRLDALLPRLPHPSLLHGDLWNGNQLADAQGRPWLIDPAAYVGDREADLAMTELFGGFAPAFYEAYRESWPLDPGYEERRELYNLYHQLNHLNHFGAGYAGGVARTLARFA